MPEQLVNHVGSALIDLDDKALAKRDYETTSPPTAAIRDDDGERGRVTQVPSRSERLEERHRHRGVVRPPVGHMW